MRNTQVFAPISRTPPNDPTMSTMQKDMSSTTTVRMAVATVESVLRIPHFARMEVSAANAADPSARNTHITTPPYAIAPTTKCGKPVRLSVLEARYSRSRSVAKNLRSSSDSDAVRYS